ncbi:MULTISPECIES: glycosyltransferase family 2 protein [Streptomyces]|uniref:GalNAc(5)-diNAcBac-PP-undecaprenol beta-1,3-glucosyltransferase n=1 Tax=Streptomyces chartreusis NRRL 3882 TaxID=1079985 RepID=A0A2N9BDL1_STRCX|nr:MULTISPECIES: glycosyltransferase family 2 protein [Streptomyces]MYS88343.1 glycosyltransferase [Streptomyces sp. SID5464]SOR81443.1 GalNAc(5)-diNAcBac-PP-undecaprenol beta-1,3-glucosyltransferase [Streptomyces chartreusis NRRL 3882]
MNAVQNPGRPLPQVAVVVIGYDDAAHVTDAVRSALAQGPAVREVVAVDDCSTDGSADLLDRLAASEPRLKVIRRRANSGGCGTPRNTGLDAVTSPYVMFLDSDDVLPPGAVDALLDAATGTHAEVASGLCVRRELPSGREVPWQARLYALHAVVPHPAQRPLLVHDTLCVNKLYRTGFLREHRIRFPEGRFPYEDVVFAARVLAAAPRIALVPDRVYVWHVRRSAERLSISLDRAGVENWRARTEACRQAYEVLLGAGQKELARVARAKFLDHDLRMYLRELGLRDAAYQRAWWELTRAHLAEYDADDWARNPAAPGRLVGRVVLASQEPRDLPRLRELAARPARLYPPYARAADGTPVWSVDLPQVSLEPLLTRPVHVLPLAVDADLRPRARGARLRLRLHELYGRLAQAGPEAVEVEWRHRDDGDEVVRRTAVLVPSAGGWSAETTVALAALAAPGVGTWDLRLRIRFRDGVSREVTAHALTGAGLLRRSAVPSARHGVVLVQPYATHSGALALRVAPGVRGVLSVARGRLRRLLH